MVARTKKTTETPTPSTPEEIKAATGSWSRAIRFLATHPDFSNPSTNKPNYSKIGKRLNKRPQHVRNVLLQHPKRPETLSSTTAVDTSKLTI